MLDQRRHQRIRFSVPQKISIGYGGEIGEGVIENLSLSGLMMRTPMPLEISRNVGCEFSVFDSPLIDVPAAVVSRVCDLFGVRFQQGPISQILIDDAISAALAVWVFGVPLRGSVFALLLISSAFLIPALGQEIGRAHV